jgi:hypothetical protein
MASLRGASSVTRLGIMSYRLRGRPVKHIKTTTMQINDTEAAPAGRLKQVAYRSPGRGGALPSHPEHLQAVDADLV